MTERALTRRVLIVEDEPDFAALLEAMLQEGGFGTSVAYDGEEALEQVRATPPDVITLDIQMPRKNGLLFYRQLKASPRFRDIPVVVVTGLTRNDIDMTNFIRVFLEAEHIPVPEAYVEKPVDKPRLLKTVEQALSAPAPRPAAREI